MSFVIICNHRQPVSELVKKFLKKILTYVVIYIYIYIYIYMYSNGKLHMATLHYYNDISIITFYKLIRIIHDIYF